MKEEEEEKRRGEDKREKKGVRCWCNRVGRCSSSSYPVRHQRDFFILLYNQGQHVPRMGGAPRPQTMKSRYNYLPMYSMCLCLMT